MSQAFGANTSRSYGATAVQSNAGFPRKDQRQEELQEMIERNIKQIKANTAELEKILEKISSGRENELLEKIARVIQETSTAATNVLKNMASLDLGQLCASSPQHRKQLERLQDDFRETVSKYYSVRNKIADQVKPLVSLSLSQDQTQQNNLHSNKQEKLSKQKGHKAVDEAIIREREAAVLQLEADILDVNDIFNDLARMVREQGETIDEIERNHAVVEDPNIRCEAAFRELQAARYHIKKKLCCLLIVVIIITLTAIAFIIYYSVKA